MRRLLPSANNEVHKNHFFLFRLRIVHQFDVYDFYAMFELELIICDEFSLKRRRIRNKQTK